MSETKHAMKLRHKAELKALQSQAAKGIGAKKKQKDDEKLMLQRHDAELKALDQQPAAAADTAAPAADQPAAAADTSQADTTAPAATTAHHQPAQSDSKEDDAHRKQQPSRAQQKRDKRLQQDKQRQAELAAEVSTMADPRADENAKLRARLAPHRLAVHEVVSDGNCLFRAVAHQLAALSPPPLPAAAATPSALRRAASAYMARHMAAFLPYLLTDADDGGDGGAVMGADEAGEYVTALSWDGSGRPGGAGGAGGAEVVWGGHAECVALAGVVGRPVHVWSADGGEMVVTGLEEQNGGGGKGGKSAGGDGAGRDVQISFHKYYFGLGNHYNSVVPAAVEHDDDDQ